MESTPVEAGDSHQGPPSEASLSANLIQGIRLAFFLRPAVDRNQAPKASWSTLVALVFLSVAIPFLGDFVQVGPKGSFSAGALAATLAAVRLLGAPKRKWLPAFFAIGLLVNLPLGIDRYRTLWSAPYDEEAVGTYQRRRAALANEDVFSLQPRLLRQQLAGLKPGKRGVIDLYFIGVAAYAGQDVFMKEVHSVKRLFDERFGTTGHSLMLINNPATVSESPIASSTSLGLALKRVAEVMDRDEDIVFLFITSHGSKEHEATFDFSPMQLKPIDPGRLKELLDRSGIKRRVVVVSACYSGTFVDVLKDPETLV